MVEDTVPVEDPTERFSVEEIINQLKAGKLIGSSSLVTKLVELGGGWRVVMNAEKFPDLKLDKEFALWLAKTGSGWVVARFPEKFQGLDEEVAFKLIESGVEGVSENLGKFQGSNEDIASKLIKTGMDKVKSDFEEFQGPSIESKETVLKRIEDGEGWDVVMNSELDLDKEVALKLIEVGDGEEVIGHLDRFQNLDEEVAIKLIEAGISRILQSAAEFNGLKLDKEFALKLIEVGKGYEVINCLNRFQNLDEEIALKLMCCDLDLMAEHLNKFEGLGKRFVLKLIEIVDDTEVTYFMDRYNKFQDLDKEVAFKLIEMGEGWWVIKNLKNFQGLVLNKEFALKLIECTDRDANEDNEENESGSRILIENLNKFQDLDKEVAFKLIEMEEGGWVTKNYEKFQGLALDKELVLKLIKQGNMDIADELASKLGLTIDDPRVTNSSLASFSEKIIIENNLDKATGDNGQLDYKEIFELLANKHGVWMDEANVGGPMSRGAEVFGYKKMFEYIKREGVSRHDQLFAFDFILKLLNAYMNRHEGGDGKELTDKFFNNILSQVRMDQSSYEDDRDYFDNDDGFFSYHRLNTLATNLNFDPSTINGYLARINELEAKGFTEEVTKLREMIEQNTMFDSWKDLQAYAGLVEMLDRADIFEKLTVLKAQAQENPRKQKLYEYVKTIMFHKYSKVNLKAAEEFFMDPEKFLARYDAHVPEDLHDQLKPSNYTQINNLDLSAEELVEALVGGDIDKISAFPAMEVIYEVQDKNAVLEAQNTATEKVPQDLPGRVIYEVGSWKQGRDTVNLELVKRLEELTRQFGVKLDRRNLAVTLEQALRDHQELKEPIEKLLEEYPNQWRIAQKKLAARASLATRYKAIVYPKSDARGALAGDDTACCMPFGSGKNNVYTFNPNCGLFILQVEKGDDWRTIAQSVLTLDQDVGQRPSGVDLTQLQNKGSYITCDNIEVALAYQNAKTQTIIGEVYASFFQDYSKIFNQNNFTNETVSTEKVIVGVGYTDHALDERIANTYLPKVPVGYSDNRSAKSYLLNFAEEQKTSVITPVEMKSLQTAQLELDVDLPRGIKPLTYQDSLDVARVEASAYPKGMEEGLSAMSNRLIAKDINNASKERPNMSFKAVGESGQLLGYMVAYQGLWNEGDSGGGGESVLYIEDLAADPKNKLAGGRLIKTFLDQYNQQYLQRGESIPILTEARDSTTFQIITKRLEQFGQQLGVSFVMEELGTENRGGELMRKIYIRVQR